jgi:hypothetical protein
MTFAVMKARIASEMKRGELTASATAVQSAILDAIDFWKDRRFTFNEFRDENHSTSASVAYVTITSTLKIVKLDSVKVTIGTRDYPLIPQTWQYLEMIDSGQWTGYPEMYARYEEDLIRMYPIPNDGYVVKLSGIKELTEISASATGSASNAWTGQAEELIRLHAKGNLFRDQLRNGEQAGVMFTQAERRYLVLQRRMGKQAGSGRLRRYYW